MYNTKIIPALIYLLIITACSSNPIEVETKPSNIKSVDGKVELYGNEKLDFSQLEIFSFHERDIINEENKFDIDISTSNQSQTIYLIDSDHNRIMSAVLLNDTEHIVINEKSTAESFVLMNPAFLGADKEHIQEIISNLPGIPKFAQLTERIHEILLDDPYELYNHQKYPEILDMTVAVGEEILQQYKNSNSLSKINGLGLSPLDLEINYNIPHTATFKNPNFVFLSANVYQTSDNKKIDTYTCLPRSGLFKLLPIVAIPYGITSSTTNYYKFDNTGRYKFIFEKGFDRTKSIGEWTDVSNAHGRATVFNILLYYINGLSVLGADILGKEGANTIISFSKSEIESIAIAIRNGEAELTDFKNARGLIDNAKKLGAFLKTVGAPVLKALGAAAGIIFKEDVQVISKAILNTLSDMIPYLGEYDMGARFLNQYLPFMDDLMFGPQNFLYRIENDSDGHVTDYTPFAEDCPVKPIIESAGWFKKEHFLLPDDYGAKITAYSPDYNHKELKYNIVVESRHKVLLTATTLIYHTGL